jgi:hypothetical protein
MSEAVSHFQSVSLGSYLWVEALSQFGTLNGLDIQLRRVQNTVLESQSLCTALASFL